MDAPRTPDLPVWDPVLPLMDPLCNFGLSMTDDVPLLVDSSGHIHGLVTGEVSAWFIYFYLKIGLGNIRLLFINIYLSILLKEIVWNCMKNIEIEKINLKK